MTMHFYDKHDPIYLELAPDNGTPHILKTKLEPLPPVLWSWNVISMTWFLLIVTPDDGTLYFLQVELEPLPLFLWSWNYTRWFSFNENGFYNYNITLYLGLAPGDRIPQTQQAELEPLPCILESSNFTYWFSTHKIGSRWGNSTIDNWIGTKFYILIKLYYILYIVFGNNGVHVIQPKSVQIPAKYGHSTAERKILFIMLCWACTFNKIQSSTLNHAILSVADQDYVVLSTVKSLEGILIEELN